jgi:hypothetical protein
MSENNTSELGARVRDVLGRTGVPSEVALRQVVLERFYRGDSEVGYGTPTSIEEGVPELWISDADYTALGEPERITVTITPTEETPDV